MIKDIITDVEKLYVRSDEFDTRKEGIKLRAVILDLKDTIKENNLTSLSGIQIGIPKRVFVINFNGDLRSFVNPVITKCEQFGLAREVDISIPGKTFIVPRYNKIQVDYQTPLGDLKAATFLGLSAHLVQKELDHLEGLFISDFGLEIDEDFDNASDDERAEVIKMYLESMDVKQKEIQSEIESDPELKKLNDAIKFIDGVVSGDVKLEGKETVVVEKKEDDRDESDNT